MKSDQILPQHISKSLSLIITFFQKNRILYVLCGAMVLPFYGRPRATLDFDFLIFIAAEQFEHIIDLAVATNFKIDTQWIHWNPLLAKMQTRLIIGKISFDIMLPRDDHDRHLFKRSIKKKVENKIIHIISPEDFIIQKIKVGRPRDFEDAAMVLQRLGSDLSLLYIHQWALRLGKAEEWLYLKSWVSSL